MGKQQQLAIARATGRYIRKMIEPITKAVEDLQTREVPRGPPGEDGKPGRDGADGASPTPDQVAEAMEGHFSRWALEFERRAQGVLERAVDRLPKPQDGDPGRDGVDGLGFDDMTVEHSGAGDVVLRFQRGEQVKEFPLRIPCFVDRGVWRDDVGDYREGHGVTFGGCYWLAQKDAPEGKPGISADWRLAVKKGRDARGGAKT